MSKPFNHAFWALYAQKRRKARLVMQASGDFTNIATSNIADGVYTLNGAPATFEDIVDLASPDTVYDPTNVDGDGIFCDPNGSQVLGLKDPLLASALGGFTVLFDLLLADVGQIQVIVHSDDYALYTSMVVTETDISFSDKNENSVVETTSDHLNVGSNKVAITCTSDRMSISINGRAVISGATVDALDPLMTAIAFGMSMGPGGEDCRLRSFAFYEPVDDADLPTLSAV